MDEIIIRTATLDDLPAITEIHNHYVVNTHVSFDVDPFTPEQRRPWFDDHSDGRRYRILVAERSGQILGLAASGRHRSKQAYNTTVETSIQCRPGDVGKGLGTRLYQTLFEQLAHEDIHRFVAGVAQLNDASNALHEKFGFRRIGTYTEVGRKFGKYWDVRWYEKPVKI